MPISMTRSLIIILLCSLTIFVTRALPFVLFPDSKKIPRMVRYLGKVLPPAVIGMLVVYCFREVSFLESPFGLPEVIAGVTVVALHVWKRNNLLSIGVGTVLYMVLVQLVFV